MRKEILVIDDSKAMRFMLHTILEKHYKVISVPDGLSAMYYLRNAQQPDLIIMDPELPDFNDWELVKYLTGNHLFSGIPLMVISGEDEESTRAKAVNCGVADFFLKPFNPLRLFEAVDNLMVNRILEKIY
jgi:DNA-binding response OmpR family regulator